MRRGVNEEAIFKTDWVSFQSLKERKMKRLSLLEVGMSIEGHRDQIERDFWRETFGERPLERDLWREKRRGFDCCRWELA